MKKNIVIICFAGVLCAVMVLCGTQAYAGGGGRGGGPAGHPGGNHHYYYRDGHWHNRGWFWFDTAVTALAVGALVDNLPPRHTTIVYQNVPYYYAEGYYYRPAAYGGYVVVAPPAPQPAVITTVSQPVMPLSPAADTVTINIPNMGGSYTPVTLRKAGSGYIGPQGEYYSEHPTVEQLKTLYGGK